MRLVIVNHCHPDTPHVCARRAATFAAELARQGHRVVLLTETLQPDDPAPDPAALPAALDGHDWRRPFVLACPPVGAPVAKAARLGKLPAGLRQAAIAGLYLGRGGLFGDWNAGTRPVWDVLAARFRPAVTWGIFGNTDAWGIARGIARKAGCPWVGDIKDYWTSFMPAPLRRVLARRFSDMAALTCLSDTNRIEAEPWFGPGTVVYSGLPAVDPPAAPPAVTAPGGDGFRLVLSGALYADAALDALIAGIRAWLLTLPVEERTGLRFVYAGAETERARRAAGALDGVIACDFPGYLPLADLVALQAGALANLYVASARTFHSKVLDLFLAGRPIVTYPSENAEVLRLGVEVGATVHSCADAGAVAEALAAVWTRRHDPGPGVDRTALARFTRTRQAEVLAAVFQRAAGGRAAA